MFTLADSKVALAIGEALAADAAYRSALDEVERARAAEEQLKRQARASSTTTTTPVAVVTDTTRSPTLRWRPLPPVEPLGRSSLPSSSGGRWWLPYFDPIMVDQALSIIQCESLGDPNAYNPYSGASGLFQFLPGTWAVTSVKAGFGGAERLRPGGERGRPRPGSRPTTRRWAETRGLPGTAFPRS